MAIKQPAENANILIVDDQSGIRMTLKRILEKRGYQISVAESGEEALEAVRKQRFQLVLMDIRMQGMTGVDAFIQIKQISPKTVVILMTAYAVEEEIRRAIREGAHAVIYKPFDMEKLLALIAECLDGKSLVLVVDDRLEDRRIIRSILEDRGYKVVESHSGEDCVQKIVEHRFQIVILDIRLPGIDGMETLRQIRGMRPGTAVMIVTAYPNEEELIEAMKGGSLAYLRKPFDVTELLSMLNKHLGIA
jgi:CheY-like chemotaxis protein